MTECLNLVEVDAGQMLQTGAAEHCLLLLAPCSHCLGTVTEHPDAGHMLFELARSSHELITAERHSHKNMLTRYEGKRRTEEQTVSVQKNFRYVPGVVAEAAIAAAVVAVAAVAAAAVAERLQELLLGLLAASGEQHLATCSVAYLCFVH